MKPPNSSAVLDMLVTTCVFPHSDARELPRALACISSILDEARVDFAVAGRVAMARYCPAQFTDVLHVRIDGGHDQADLEQELHAKTDEILSTGSTVRLQIDAVRGAVERRMMRLATCLDWLGVPTRVAASEHLLWLACSNLTLQSGVDAIDLWNSGHVAEALFFELTGRDPDVVKRARRTNLKARQERGSNWSTYVERRYLSARNKADHVPPGRAILSNEPGSTATAQQELGMNTEWSENARKATRDALEDFDVAPCSEAVFLKHASGRFGSIAIADILSRRLRVVDRETEAETLFSNVDALIDSGWVLD